jgi:hypothetical protein
MIEYLRSKMLVTKYANLMYEEWKAKMWSCQLDERDLERARESYANETEE